MDENNDFSVFSTARLQELKTIAVQLGFWDDVIEYETEIRRRNKN